MNDEDTTECINITDLPSEIILEIFSYINVHILFKHVVLTCKYFHNILTANGFWESLIALKFQEFKIHEDLPYIRSLRDVCFTLEDVDNYWINREKRNIQLKTKKLIGHYGAVDAVYISKNGRFCISGSRDRTAIFWRLTDFINEENENERESYEVLHGHEGWVWAISSDPMKENEVVTCSWDKTVKIWDMSCNGELVDTLTYHPSAILALQCHDNVYTTGCYDKFIRTYDRRSGNLVLKSNHHKRAVICVEVSDHYIISGSEDKTVGIFDIRAGKLKTTLRVDSPVLTMNLGLDQGYNYLRIGGKDGSFYLYDLYFEKLSLLNMSQLWKNYKVTNLCNFQGSLVACSQGGSVRMYTPDRNMKFLERFDKHHGDVAAAHSSKDILVTGGSDNTVLAWKFSELM